MKIAITNYAIITAILSCRTCSIQSFDWLTARVAHGMISATALTATTSTSNPYSHFSYSASSGPITNATNRSDLQGESDRHRFLRLNSAYLGPENKWHDMKESDAGIASSVLLMSNDAEQSQPLCVTCFVTVTVTDTCFDHYKNVPRA